jgi:hypothetical protein
MIMIICQRRKRQRRLQQLAFDLFFSGSWMGIRVNYAVYSDALQNTQSYKLELQN